MPETTYTIDRKYWEEQLKYALMASEDLRFPKSWREEQLRKAREAERQLERADNG